MFIGSAHTVEDDTFTRAAVLDIMVDTVRASRDELLLIEAAVGCVYSDAGS